MNKEFKIHIPITRAYTDENGEMLFEGIASSTSVDSHETIFSEECIEGFVEDVSSGISRLEPIELESEHNGDQEPMNLLGPVISAEIIDGNKFRILARLDSDNPKSVYYYNKMTKPDPITLKTKQFGLSINGTVHEAHYEFNAQLNKTIRVFDRVVLKRVGIVRKPSNPDSWIEKLIRSVEWDNIEIKERSEKQMSKDTNNQESVVDATETRNDEVEVVDASASEVEVAEVVSDAQVEAAPELAEVAADAETETEVEVVVVADADADATEPAVEEAETETRTEEAVADADTTEVTRTSWWTSNVLVEAMEETIEVICQLEGLASCDHEAINAGMTDEAVMMAKGLFAKLQAILGDHVSGANEQMRSDEDAAEVVVEEVVVEEAATDDAVVEESVVTDAEPETRSEVDLLTPVIDAMTSYMDKEFTESLTRKFEDMLKDKLAALETVSKDEVEELKRNLEALQSEKAELVVRLEKVESEPASKPAAQLLEVVNRTKELADKKAENLQRAKEEGNSNELVKHMLFKEKYLGYGEFA